MTEELEPGPEWGNAKNLSQEYKYFVKSTGFYWISLTLIGFFGSKNFFLVYTELVFNKQYLIYLEFKFKM